MISEETKTVVNEEDLPVSSETKEYQTLFWVPMLFQTAKSAYSLIDEMLDMIQDFHDLNNADIIASKEPIVKPSGGIPKRRQQILGDAVDSEVSTTRVDVVMKPENTKFLLLSVLKRHFLFSQLRDYDLNDVIDAMQCQYVNENDIIIQQGDTGDVFYILEEGKAEIFIDNKPLGFLEAGSSFGDLALMYNSPRAASIIAKTACTLWTLDRVFFRQAMVTSSSNQNVQLSQFLSKISLFATLGPAQLNQLARSLTKQTYEDGHYIIRQGDLSDEFYVIYKGKVVVSKTDDSGKEHILLELGEGEVFGERALIKKEPRGANIICNGPVECYFLESQDFYSMLGSFVEKFNKMNEFRIIRSAKIFSPLNDEKLKELINSFKFYRMFSRQRQVCGLGEIFIVIDGQFTSALGDKYSSDDVVEVGSLQATADITAGALTTVSDEGILASFTKEQLLEMIKKQDDEDINKLKRNSYFDIKSGKKSNLLSSSSSSSSSFYYDELNLTMEKRKEIIKSKLSNKTNYLLNDFVIKKLLGKGTFGLVYLCQSTKDNFKEMALKCLDKQAVMRGGQHPNVRREIIALKTFSHPFIADYYGLINSPLKIYFLMEYIKGGELWNYLYIKKNKFKNEQEAGPFGGLSLRAVTLYAANVILALQHIHELGYVYRDLKPENLLINSNGYLKIIDFSFAKQVPFITKTGQVQYRTFTLCGTPDYMAPELILTQGHDRSVDYWSYGILLYELLCGHTPFDSTNQQRTFEKIVHAQRHLVFPSDFDAHCKSLIRRLLHPNAALRLGALQNGIQDIISHAFFSLQEIDFDKLLNQEVPMPYIPEEEEEVNGDNECNLFNIEEELSMEPCKEFDAYFENINDPENEEY